MENTFSLEIISPIRKVFEGEVSSVTVPGTLGSFQVLRNHAALMSSIEIGKVIIKKDNEVVEFSTSGGIFEVKNNKAIILAESIESRNEIDLKRANLSKVKAEEILASADATAEEREEAKLALQRAINRIELSNTKQ